MLYQEAIDSTCQQGVVVMWSMFCQSLQGALVTGMILSDLIRCTSGIMIIIIGNGHGNLSSNFQQALCISYRDTTLGKVINPASLPSAISK